MLASTLLLRLAILIWLAICGRLAAEPTGPLVLERTIPLKGVSGRIDHLAIDLGRKRLFVAELGNGTIDVVDIAAGVAVRRMEGFKEPQGLVYAPAADVLAVASAGDGSVRLFHGSELSPSGTVNLGDDADNIRLDALTGNLIVGYGDGALAIINPGRASLRERILLRAHPEGFQIDAERQRAYVNVPDAGQIAVVDLHAGRQTTSWHVPDGLRANFPMALDTDRARAAVAFRKPPRLVVFDVDSGKPIGSFATCGDADDVFFDARRRRVYVSCGEGDVDVWQQDGPSYRQIGLVRTAPGARTSLFGT